MVLASVATAYAYLESQGEPWGASYLGGNATSECSDCHEAAAPPFGPSGPHGGYTNSTDKCATCHTVHEADSSFNLLPAATTFEICNSCHDMSFSGSGGRGVYGAIIAQGQVVGARHSILGYNNTVAAYAGTSTIPGSNLSALDTTLSCAHCHTPHGATNMATFLGERERTWNGVGLIATASTNKILQDNPGDQAVMPRIYTTYGSAWCAACHNRRHEGAAGPLNNHPTDNTTVYGATSAADGNNTWQTFVSANATLPAHQAGWSREATTGWAPLCQQCHEDVRNVEAAYRIESTDGTSTTDNPRFQTFPHETLSDNMVVETGDDLCLNCHPTTGLP